MDNTKPKKLSIIIPVFNEEKSIPLLYEEIKKTLNKNNFEHEIIFVDDGSTDDSFEEIKKISDIDNNVQIIRFRKNFGKSLALSAAFQKASGDYTITLDGDLQDNPSEIPNLVKKLEEGWDIVSGWKIKRNDPLEKTLPSKLFNATVSLVSGVKLHDHNCGLKIYRTEVVKAVKIYGEHHRYIPVIASGYGFKSTEIPVNHRKRSFGTTKFGIGRYLAGFFDLFTILFLINYNRRPLHFIGKIAILPFCFGTLLVLYVMLMKFGFGQTGNRPSLIAGVFFLGIGFQVFFFGLLAELITYGNYDKNIDFKLIEKNKEENNVNHRR